MPHAGEPLVPMRSPPRGAQVVVLAVAGPEARLPTRTVASRSPRVGNNYTGSRVEDWYWIGLAAGLGVGAGVLLTGLLARHRIGLVLAAVAAAAIGAGAGFGLDNWDEAIGGGAGGLAGALSAAPVVAGALRHGGTRGGTATIVAGAGLALAALGLIPGFGYLEAGALPLLAARLRRRGGDRYAGLRILARD